MSGNNGNANNNDDNADTSNGNENSVQRQINEANSFMGGIGSLINNVTGMLGWVLVAGLLAVVGLPLIRHFFPDFENSDFGRTVTGWFDQGLMAVENMTNGAIGGGTTQRVLDAATPERRAEILQQGGIPSEVASYIADTTHYNAIKTAVGGNIRTLNTKQGMERLIRTAPAEARGLIDAYARARAANTSGNNAVPSQIISLLQDQTLFASLMGNAESRAVMLHAVESFGPRNAAGDGPAMTAAEIERLLSGTPPSMTVEQFRALAVRAAQGQDITADITALAGTIAATAPVDVVAETLIPDTAANATEARASVAGMITNLRANFTTEQVTTITGALAGTGAINPMTIIQSMYTANAAGANAFLSNADNLAAINTLLTSRATAGAAPTLASTLLSSAQGRTAMATLVQELGAIDPQAPLRLLSALAPAEGQTQTTLNIGAMARALSPDNNRVQTARYLEALRHFSTNLEGVAAEPNSELGRLKTSLAQVNDASPSDVAVAASLADAPGVLDAVTRIKDAADQNVNGAFRLIMRDENLRHALAPTATETSVNLPELGRALGELASDERGNLPLAFLAHRNPTSGNYGNLNATFTLIENLDRVTGGTGGAEAAADNMNADVMSVVMAMAAGQHLEVDTDVGMFGSRGDYRVKVPGTNRWIKANDMADLFAKPEVAAAFAQFFETASSVTGSPLQNVMAAMNENFWVDRNSNGQVDGNEGLASVLADKASIGQVLQYWDEIRAGRFDGARPEGWLGRLDLTQIGLPDTGIWHDLNRMATDGRIAGNKDALTAIGDAVTANPAIAAMHRAPRAAVAAH